MLAMVFGTDTTAPYILLCPASADVRSQWNARIDEVEIMEFHVDNREDDSEIIYVYFRGRRLGNRQAMASPLAEGIYMFLKAANAAAEGQYLHRHG